MKILSLFLLVLLVACGDSGYSTDYSRLYNDVKISSMKVERGCGVIFASMVHEHYHKWYDVEQLEREILPEEGMGTSYKVLKKHFEGCGYTVEKIEGSDFYAEDLFNHVKKNGYIVGIAYERGISGWEDKTIVERFNDTIGYNEHLNKYNIGTVTMTSHIKTPIYGAGHVSVIDSAKGDEVHALYSHEGWLDVTDPTHGKYFFIIVKP